MTHPGQAVEKVIAAEAVGLDDTLIVTEEGAGHIAGPGRVILIEERRSLRVAPAEQPHVRGGGGGPTGFGQHLQGGFVDIDQSRIKNLVADQVEQRFAGLGGADRPVGHGGAADVHAEAGEEPLLAVERQMVDELGGEHLGQEPRADDGLGNDLRRHGCDPHRRPLVLHPFAAAAGVLGADVAEHLDAGRDDVELLAHLFADAA